jgi:hypothetical protein
MTDAPGSCLGATNRQGRPRDLILRVRQGPHPTSGITFFPKKCAWAAVLISARVIIHGPTIQTEPLRLRFVGKSKSN